MISQTALFAYKCTDIYNPQNKVSVIWNDPDIGINWPITNPILSDKDKKIKSYEIFKQTSSLQYPYFQYIGNLI